MCVSSNGAYHSFAINGLRAIKVFELLRSINIPKFSRKWDCPKMLEAAARYRRDYPEFFTPDLDLAFSLSGQIVFAQTLAPAAA